MKSAWQLQEAKNQLSLVVENALTRGAQTITRHGEPSVVVVSVAEYCRLRPRRRGLVGILLACPVPDLEFDRMRDLPPVAGGRRFPRAAPSLEPPG